MVEVAIESYTSYTYSVPRQELQDFEKAAHDHLALNLENPTGHYSLRLASRLHLRSLRCTTTLELRLITLKTSIEVKIHPWKCHEMPGRCISYWKQAIANVSSSGSLFAHPGLPPLQGRGAELDVAEPMAAASLAQGQLCGCQCGW